MMRLIVRIWHFFTLRQLEEWAADERQRGVRMEEQIEELRRLNGWANERRERR
jgi:hypothetical protein